MRESCVLFPSLPVQGTRAARRNSSVSRPRARALLVSAGLHALGCALLFVANMAGSAPAPPAVVEMRFVEIAGPTGGGGGGGRTTAVEQASPSSSSRPAAPARAVPAAAVAKPVASAAHPAPRPKPQPVAQAAPPAVTSATSRPAVHDGASLETSIGAPAGPAGGAATEKAGSGSGSGSGPGAGPGAGGGFGGGAGTGVGRNSGPGSGQGGVAVDRMPVAVERVKPVYPMAARRRGLNGRVVLRLYVDAKGGVREVRVQSAEPPDMFEEQAVAAVRRWRFTPAMFHGAPVGMWMTLPVRFTLDGR